MPPVEHSVSWHNTIRMARSVCHPIINQCAACSSVVVMLHVWYAIVFLFNSHLGNFPFLFFFNFQTFPLGVRFRIRLAFALRLGFKFRVSVKG